jgi:hypothetical protein
MMASVISNLCHIGMAPLPGAFVMARHFAFAFPKRMKTQGASRVLALDPRPA